MISYSATLRAGTSFHAAKSNNVSHNKQMSLQVSNSMEIESRNPSFDDGMDLFHQKPTTMMEMDTVVSAQSQAFVAEHRTEAKEQQNLEDELQDVAVSSMTRGDFELAEEAFRHLLHLQTRGNGAHDMETIRTLANIGKCCQLTGRLQEAMSCFNAALQIKSHQELDQEPHSVQLLLASILYEIGMIHSKLFVTGSQSTAETNGEHLQKAMRAFQLALKLRQRCLDKQHHAVASVQHNIGALLTAAGMPSAALSYHEKALTIRRTALGEQHPEVASSLRHMATSHKALGNYQEAAAYLSEALNILKCIPCDPFLQETIIELAHVQRALL